MYQGLGARPDFATDQPVHDSDQPGGSSGGDGPGTKGGSRSRRSGLNGTVVALGLTSFFSDISSEMVAAVVPIFLTEELGYSPFAFGLFLGGYELASALLRLLGGHIADRTRRPKETALSGYAISTGTRAGLVASVLGGITPIPFLIADRFGKGLRTAPRDAMISLATPPSSWGSAFGIHRSMDAAGALIGPILAFFVLSAVPGSYDSVFVLSFGFGLLGVAIIATRVSNPSFAHVPEVSTRRIPMLDLLRNRGYVRIVLAGGLFGLFSVGDSLLYLVIFEASQSQTSIGLGGFGIEWFPLFFAGTAVVFLTAAPWIGRLSDTVGRGRVWFMGQLFLAATYILLTIDASSRGVVILVLALLGLYYASTDGVLPALAATVIPEQQRSGGLAMLTTVVALARMTSAIGFGLIWSRNGADGALVVATFGLLGVTLLLAAHSTYDRTRRKIHGY